MKSALVGTSLACLVCGNGPPERDHRACPGIFRGVIAIADIAVGKVFKDAMVPSPEQQRRLIELPVASAPRDRSEKIIEQIAVEQSKKPLSFPEVRTFLPRVRKRRRHGEGRTRCEERLNGSSQLQFSRAKGLFINQSRLWS